MNKEAEFPLRDDIIYLNHAAVSPWPLRTSQAIQCFAVENMTLGATHYPDWMDTEQRLRERLARLINAPSADDISLVKNTSEALSFVAHGIDWKAGDNVLLFRQEFPSNRIVWESLKPFGVEIRELDLFASEDPEALLLAAADENTRLLTISSVQYAAGLRMDIQRLGRFCHDRRILFCIDAIQSLGALAFDVQQCQADFVMADGHKWMLGPEGLALFYSRPAARERLLLHQYGWHMLEKMGDFDQVDWQPASSGRRFECGTPNMLGIHGLEASIALIEQAGIQSIEHDVLSNTRYIIELVNKNTKQLELISNLDQSRLSGIVSFRVKDAVQESVYRQLMKRGVICACRGYGIRFSPHFYTPREKIERAFEILGEII